MAAVAEYFSMGGHAGFIWTSYAVAAVVLIGLLIGALHHVRRNETRLLELRAARRGDPDSPEESAT
jgi:heme exporter protein D